MEEVGGEGEGKEGSWSRGGRGVINHWQRAQDMASEGVDGNIWEREPREAQTARKAISGERERAEQMSGKRVTAVNRQSWKGGWKGQRYNAMESESIQAA